MIICDHCGKSSHWGCKDVRTLHVFGKVDNPAFANVPNASGLDHFIKTADLCYECNRLLAIELGDVIDRFKKA
jgi:hypothetical protein